MTLRYTDGELMRIQRRMLRSSIVLSISYALIGRSMSAPKIMISIEWLAIFRFPFGSR